MLVRIQGKITAINMEDGVSKANKPWSKKVYVVEDKWSKVHVNDFGKLRPESYGHEFDFKSNHIVGEEVDLACYLETNDNGFTNVNYGRPFEDIAKPLPVADTTEPQPEEPAPVMQSENSTDLPF